ncbi:MAG: leucine-rich repeat domain-containing protein [Lachnospiraceae bacterium]|nr:leucine-rich repeat domain-containing protein [Lachnospiraceae bacterium]
MKVKKIICMFVSMLMMAGSFTLFAGMQTKAADTLQFQDWKYSVLDDGTVEISGYNGDETEIVIPSELDGKMITGIGYNAFANCADLTSIEIPSSVTSIENRAFNNCSSLTSIEIPSNVTYIGFAAFLGCDSLTSIEVPASVEIIGYAAFGDCSNLVNITVDSASLYYSSKDGVLYDKDKTEVIACPAGKTGNVTIAAGVTSIADEAFCSCSKLTSVEIPAGVETIGNFAFMDCSSLTSLQIPSSVELINYKVFSGCTTALTFYGEAGSYAEYFAKVNNIKFVVRNMQEEATTEADWKYSVLDDGTVEISGYNGDETEIVIPSELDGKMITGIGYNAFANCADLTSIEIPSSVTSIENRAFNNCSSLTSIEIPSNVTYIGFAAFLGCDSLTSIEVPASVEIIGYAAFGDCSNLVNITVDSASLYYSSKDGVLYDKDKTEVITCPAGKTGNVTIAAGVTSIADEAFCSCNKLTSVEIPAGVETIGNFAFMDCSSLTSLQIPSSVEVISYNKVFSGCPAALTFYGEAGSYAEFFAKNNNIKFVVRNMPEETTTEETTTEETTTEDTTTEASTTEAATTEAPTPAPVSTPKVGESFKDTKSKGQYKITGNQAVTYIKTTATSGKVTIPATVTYKGQTFKVTAVYKNAFRNKTGITGVTLGDNITSIGNEAFYNCKALTQIKLGSKVTTIGTSAFAGCTKLKKVTLNAKLTTIGNSAFSKCTALTSITIPKNVNKIGKQAFYGCKKLKSITINTTKLKSSNIGSNAFKGIHAKATIKVPKSKKTAYIKLLKSKGAGKNVTYK